ncbi:MAG: hypothetical protein ACERKZ_18810 [Lachnotalea sp.]
MNIINNQNFITNIQLTKILALLSNQYMPHNLIICECRKDVFRLYKFIKPIDYLLTILDMTILFGKVEGINYIEQDIIIIYIFAQDYEEYDNQDKQLYSLHALFHEARHRWQKLTNYVGDEEKDADYFATTYINKNSKKISKIMNWADEWEVEEED